MFFRTLACAIAGIALLAESAPCLAQGSPADRLISELEQKVDSDPQVAALGALKRRFPADYARAVEQLRKAVAAAPAADLNDPVKRERMGFDNLSPVINEVIERDGEAFASADPALLNRALTTSIAVMTELRALNPTACLSYAIGEPIGLVSTTPAVDRALQADVAAFIDAIGDGKARNKPHPEPSDNDLAAFDGALQKLGAPADLLDQLEKGKKVPEAQAAQQCDRFILAQKAVAALDPPVRVRMIAYRIVESLVEQ